MTVRPAHGSRDWEKYLLTFWKYITKNEKIATASPKRLGIHIDILKIYSKKRENVQRPRLKGLEI
jgi:hypothetical protein